MVTAVVFLVTAYCLPGRTFTGTRARPGVVATDPHLLGKTIRVGHWHLHAEDTGAYIHGLHIDVWMKSCRAALLFGVQHLKGTIAA
jgi:3D (Asp-Asp-Asp) domain-containing protein